MMSSAASASKPMETAAMRDDCDEHGAYPDDFYPDDFDDLCEAIDGIAQAGQASASMVSTHSSDMYDNVDISDDPENSEVKSSLDMLCSRDLEFEQTTFSAVADHSSIHSSDHTRVASSMLAAESPCEVLLQLFPQHLWEFIADCSEKKRCKVINNEMETTETTPHFCYWHG